MKNVDKVYETKTHIIVFAPAIFFTFLLPLSINNSSFIFTNILFILFFLAIALHFYYKKKILITGSKIKAYDWRGKCFEINYQTELESIYLSDSFIKQQIGLGDLLIKKTDGSFYEFLFISNGRKFLKNVIDLHEAANRKRDPDYTIERFGL